MTDIRETRICVQQVLPHQKDEFHGLAKKSPTHEHHQKLAAAFWAKKLWPKDSKIRIGFLGTGKQITKTAKQALMTQHGLKGEPLDPLQDQVESHSVQQMVKMVVRERIIPLVNLDIDFVDNPAQANVRVAFDPNGGAWSLVGTDHLHETDHTKPTINLGWFDVPTCIHEFGHMLGMIHEHQNPRGQSIQWNDAKLFAWAKATQGWDEKTTETNIIRKYNISSINGSNFDPCSIMLYFFPANLTRNNVGSHQNLRLSGTDVEWITKMYPGPKVIKADKFYNDTYGDSIQKNIEKCDKEASSFSNSGGILSKIQLGKVFNWKIIFIVIGIILVVLVIIFFIHKMKKSQPKGRYGYF